MTNRTNSDSTTYCMFACYRKVGGLYNIGVGRSLSLAPSTALSRPDAPLFRSVKWNLTDRSNDSTRPDCTTHLFYVTTYSTKVFLFLFRAVAPRCSYLSIYLSICPYLLYQRSIHAYSRNRYTSTKASWFFHPHIFVFVKLFHVPPRPSSLILQNGVGTDAGIAEAPHCLWREFTYTRRMTSILFVTMCIYIYIYMCVFQERIHSYIEKFALVHVFARTPFYTILFYLLLHPVSLARAAYVPSGRPWFVRARDLSLVPTRHLFTNTSHTPFVDPPHYPLIRHPFLSQSILLNAYYVVGATFA